VRLSSANTNTEGEKEILSMVSKEPTLAAMRATLIWDPKMVAMR